MSSAQKVAVSILTAVILFTGFVFLGQTTLMSKIQTRFYAQSKVTEKQNQLKKLTDNTDAYIEEILNKIILADNAYLKNNSVRTYTIQNPTEKDEVERRRETTRIFDEIEELDGMRLVDDNAKTIHYSSYYSDVLNTNGNFKTYKNYPDINELDYGYFDFSDKDYNLLFDRNQNRIILAVPYHITDSVTRGKFLFYFNFYKICSKFIDNSVLSLGENLTLVSSDSELEGGIVSGLPLESQKDFYEPVLSAWKNNSEKERILEAPDNSYYLLFTDNSSKFFKVSSVYKSTVFELSREFICLIYVCVFITLVLICMLLFNIRRDYLTKIRERIKKVQMGIINEYLENKEKIEWAQVSRQLDLRKEELSQEIKKSIGNAKEKYSKQVDEYIDASWKEIIEILGGDKNNQKTQAVLGENAIDEIRKVIEEVLVSARLHVNLDQINVQEHKLQTVEPVSEIEEIEDAQELESLDSDVEEIEEIDEIEDADNVEEIEDIEEAADEKQIKASASEEELEELEEVSEDETQLLTIKKPLPVKYDYFVSDDTFIGGATDEFATVDNIFAEDLCIGPQYTTDYPELPKNFTFTAETPHFGKAQKENEEEIEEAELIPEAEMFYTMTEFGAKILPAAELQSEQIEAIVENQGVYSISDNINYTDIIQDSEFKSLVDSVLR